jgi:hypothetical protein
LLVVTVSKELYRNEKHSFVGDHMDPNPVVILSSCETEVSWGLHSKME